jgi:hypothetical protein
MRESLSGRFNKRKREAFDEDDYLEQTTELRLSSNLSQEYLESHGAPRNHTVSVAIPASIISNAHTRELKTFMIGQIARCIALNKVDEVVVYADGASEQSSDSDSNPCLFLSRLLQYAETPSYLRKALFPVV